MFVISVFSRSVLGSGPLQQTPSTQAGPGPQLFSLWLDYCWISDNCICIQAPGSGLRL